jgi:uncharacterized protein
MSPAARLLIAPIRLWQWLGRPLFAPACRFTPGCSEYAVEALARHGALRGAALAARRLLRCNPWNAGGFDPVPPAKAR